MYLHTYLEIHEGTLKLVRTDNIIIQYLPNDFKEKYVMAWKNGQKIIYESRL